MPMRPTVDESRWYVPRGFAIHDTQQWDGPAPKSRRYQMARSFAVHRCTVAASWACSAGPDEMIAWYVALLSAAVGWVCAAALDENPWYVALLHSELV